MRKDDVLALLKAAEAPLSGEAMSRALGVSRAAVWKAVEALRGEGYAISSAPRRGYLLEGSPDVLSAGELSAVCSNLARGCEKQYQAAEAEAFKKLAEEFRTHAAKPADASFDMLLEKIDEELTSGYPMTNTK